MRARFTSEPDPPGLIHGRYELIRLLGRGGMSEVHLGHDRELDRTVAIKFVPAQPHEGPEQGDRLRREARAVAAIDHPNVVSVYDIGTFEDSSRSTESVFVVMEYVNGESVRARVGRDGPLASDVAVDIAGKACLALHAAHEAGIVHRDISPGNIMLCRDGTVKVLDFGIAHMAGSAFHTATGDVLGTPAYLSPEQVQGQPLDARSDLYSLGCCLYLMVTGESPFSGGEALAVAYQHVRAQPVSPREIKPGVDLKVEAVILRALAKDPDERHPSAKDMKSELFSSGVADTQLIQQPASDSTERMTSPTGTLSLPRDSREQAEADHGLRRETTTDPDIDQEDSGSVRRWVGIALIVVAIAVLLVLTGFAIFETFFQR